MAATSKFYGKDTWKAIKQEWIAGQLSLSEISRSYGPSRPAILKHAKKKKWPARGTLQEEVRREIGTALVTGQDPGVVTAEVTPEETTEIIEGAAKRGLAVISVHKGLLARLLRQVDVTLSEMEEMQRIKLDLLLKERLKHRNKLVTAIIRNRTDALDSVSKVLARAIPLERLSFSLDSEKGEIQSIRYVINGEIKKPKGTGMSEDEWDKPEAQDTE
jgi:hypothetical protein